MELRDRASVDGFGLLLLEIGLSEPIHACTTMAAEACELSSCFYLTGPASRHGPVTGCRWCVQYTTAWQISQARLDFGSSGLGPHGASSSRHLPACSPPLEQSIPPQCAKRRCKRGCGPGWGQSRTLGGGPGSGTIKILPDFSKATSPQRDGDRTFAKLCGRDAV